jgi:hypothetical protein
MRRSILLLLSLRSFRGFADKTPLRGRAGRWWLRVNREHHLQKFRAVVWCLPGHLRKKQVSVFLERIDLLSISAHKNFAVKNTVCISVHHNFVELVAVCMRKPVIHHRVSICNLFAVNQYKSVQCKVYLFIFLNTRGSFRVSLAPSVMV